MQIILSNSIKGDDVNVINNVVAAIFKANNTNITSFDTSRSLVISNNTEDKADFLIDIASFLSDNRSYKMIVFKNLANTIFNKYVDPRDIIGVYENVSTGTIAPEPVVAPEPIVKQIEKLEQELEVIKSEASTKTAVFPN